MSFSKNLAFAFSYVAGLCVLGAGLGVGAAALTSSPVAASPDYSTVDRAVTLSGSAGETMVATSTGSTIDLPPMVIAATTHRAVKPVPFKASRCAALLAKWGNDADYRCPRSHSRSAPTSKVARTFLHEMTQGGSTAPMGSVVIVHDYQDAE
jgi:hypothetical protein